MSLDHQSSITQLPEFQSHPVDTSVAYVLLWLASSAGTFELGADSALNEHLKSLDLSESIINKFYAMAGAGEADNLVEILEILKTHLKQDEKQFLLDIAVLVSTKDQSISEPANHILRFIADFVSVTEDELQSLYRQQHQIPLPNPGDLSSSTWWSAFEFRESADKHQGVQLTREQALAVLELTEGVKAEEVKRVYRRKVQRYHPDRFEKYGKKAMEAAESKFILVQKAYEVLK